MASGTASASAMISLRRSARAKLLLIEPSVIPGAKKDRHVNSRWLIKLPARRFTKSALRTPIPARRPLHHVCAVRPLCSLFFACRLATENDRNVSVGEVSIDPDVFDAAEIRNRRYGLMTRMALVGVRCDPTMLLGPTVVLCRCNNGFVSVDLSPATLCKIDSDLPIFWK